MPHAPTKTISSVETDTQKGSYQRNMSTAIANKRNANRDVKGLRQYLLEAQVEKDHEEHKLKGENTMSQENLLEYACCSGNPFKLCFH